MVNIQSQAERTDPPSEIGAKQLAGVARQFEKQRTGRMPESVTAALVEDSLVITLHEELSPTEIELAKTPEGAAQVQELHRQAFRSSCNPLLKEIEVITEVSVREATSEVATDTGTVVQDFRLEASVPASTWSESTAELTSVDPSCGKKERVLDGEG